MTDDTLNWVWVTATGVVPATATKVRLVIVISGTGGASEVHYVDRMQIYNGTGLGWVVGGTTAQTDQERVVTLVNIDADGLPVDVATKAAVETYLNAMREINFVVYTMDAQMHEIDVSTHVTLVQGYAADDVTFRVKEAIKQFLDPALWGISPSDDPNNPRTWNNATLVRYLELASTIDRVSGVDNVASLLLGLHGGSMGTSDLSLTGIVPLPYTQDADITVYTP
jgi:hypothetical protein